MPYRVGGEEMTFSGALMEMHRANWEEALIAFYACAWASERAGNMTTGQMELLNRMRTAAQMRWSRLLVSRSMPSHVDNGSLVDGTGELRSFLSAEGVHGKHSQQVYVFTRSDIAWIVPPEDAAVEDVANPSGEPKEALADVTHED